MLYHIFFSYFTYYRIELLENIPAETLSLFTCTDKDKTVPDNKITYYLEILDTFSNEPFILTNNQLKVGILKILSYCGL